MAITMKDVAEHAGISLGTVSNYITGKTHVSEDKRKRIEEAIKVLGYQVNVAARSLRTKSFHTIGILIPDFHNVYLLRVISYIEEILHEHGYSILVLSYHRNAEKEKEQFQYVAQRVDGIIFAPSYLNEDGLDYIKKVQKKIPVVVFNEMMEGMNSDCVLVNSMEAVNKAITALLEKGNKKIAMLAGPSYAYTSQQRLLGYRQAFEQHQVAVDDNLIAFGDYSKTFGEAMCEKLLASHHDITAIFVAGYRMMLGTISALQKENKLQRVSVIGYDASDVEDILNPKISYVYQPYVEVAKHVSRLILKRVNNDYTDYPVTINLEADIRNIDLLRQL